jgi:ABC-type nitrate/sulfonate/bicarbonate transport system ATPase subunit
MSTPKDVILDINDVYTTYPDGKGGQKNVLARVNLQVPAGQFVSIVGKSGCGKSTLIRHILGIEQPSSGAVIVHLNGTPVHVTNADRNRGVVFQRYTLNKSLTAIENVAWGLKVDETNIPYRLLGCVCWFFIAAVVLGARIAKRTAIIAEQAWCFVRFRVLPPTEHMRTKPFVEKEASPLPRNTPRKWYTFYQWRRLRKQHLMDAAEILEKVGLGEELDKYPDQLSGGMSQRVAVAKALIMRPAILLMDEPFGAVDEAIRKDLQKLLLRLKRQNQAAIAKGERPPHTILIVTHELNEAMIIGDRVVGLSRTWERPTDPRCAGAATIVYDELCQVYMYNKVERYAEYVAQRSLISRVVFDEQEVDEEVRVPEPVSVPQPVQAI